MSISGKIWGSTTLMLKTPLIEVHRLEVVPGGYCSWHMHRHKWNCFLVFSGSLTIEIRKEAYPLTDKTVLRAGDITTVKPGEEHRFVAGVVAAVAFEIYYPEMLSEDIVRSDIGGINEKLAQPMLINIFGSDDEKLPAPMHHQV